MCRIVYDKKYADDWEKREQLEKARSRFGDVVFLKPDATSYKRRIVLTGDKRILNPEIWAIRMPTVEDPPVYLTYDERQAIWVVENLDDIKPFEWFDINRSLLRHANTKYNITEFVMAIEAMMGLGVDVKNAGTSKRDSASQVHKPVIDPETGEEMTILELLEAGRYVDAAALVRINQTSTWDAEAKRYNTETQGVKKRDIKKIRNMAYQELGVTYLEQRPMVRLPKLVEAEQKLVDFGKPITDQVL